jgi:low affinity Fe/Cu permease
MLSDGLRQALTRVGEGPYRPVAFLIWALFAVLWFVFDRQGFDWHGVATLATWLMTLFIQRAEHRDAQAIHAKLDETLRALGRADNRLAHIDKLQPEEIERRRDKARKTTNP